MSDVPQFLHYGVLHITKLLVDQIKVKSHLNEIVINVNCYNYGSCLALGHTFIVQVGMLCISPLLLSLPILSCMVSGKAYDIHKTIGLTKL